MALYRNLNELAKHFNAEAKKSLKNDVAPFAKDKMQSHVETDVYNPYVPVQYERTGGLKRDIEIRETVDGVSITPTRTDEETGKYIPSVIESGQGYTYSGGYAYERPRPFVSNTHEELKNTGAHVEKLKQSLKAKGFDVK